MNTLIEETSQDLENGMAYLYLLIRTGQYIAGVTQEGRAVTKTGLLDDLTDDELLELLRKVSVRQESK